MAMHAPLLTWVWTALWRMHMYIYDIMLSFFLAVPGWTSDQNYIYFILTSSVLGGYPCAYNHEGAWCELHLLESGRTSWRYGVHLRLYDMPPRNCTRMDIPIIIIDKPHVKVWIISDYIRTWICDSWVTVRSLSLQLNSRTRRTGEPYTKTK